MNIFLTGATGYIGRRLLNALLLQGHTVYAAVRIGDIVVPKAYAGSLHVIHVDFLNDGSRNCIPSNIDVAFYLIHSMSDSSKNFDRLERSAINNYVVAAKKAQVNQTIYLSGIAEGDVVSKHLRSRLSVEKVLVNSGLIVTVLRAGIVVGAGSASFEIIRDIAEKLPVMITPKWLLHKCQPIGIQDVIIYLTKVMANKECFGKVYDIGGPDILSFKDMILKYAEKRKLKRLIITVPLLTPKLSSLWIYLISRVNFNLTYSLVESLGHDVIVKNNTIKDVIPHKCATYVESLDVAFAKIEGNCVVSSWSDAWDIHINAPHLKQFVEMPTFGCFHDKRSVICKGSIDRVVRRMFSIGSEKEGWLALNWLWEVRGFLDKLCGGVGQRGRKKFHTLVPGDAIDMFRVIVADEKEKRLLLYAEMKLPGEGWLEFKIEGNKLIQTACFRPVGIFGRLYWYAMLPFHFFLFRKLMKKMAS